MSFTLELLHFADQEAGAAAVADAPNLSAVLEALRLEDVGDDGVPDNTLTLSSGDAFIPGVFYDASEAVFGAGGIGDIQIQNELGVQAIAFGNHEFDFGTRTLSELVTGLDVTDDSDPEDGFVDTVPQAIGDFSALSGTALDGQTFAGTAFPYLSANLDFSTDPFLAPLAVAGGLAPQPNVVAPSTVIDVNGELVGVVGTTTPTLDVISSPEGVTIAPADYDGTPTDAQLDALAAIVQAEVDALLAANPAMDKVIVLSHQQRFDIEVALAERLENVDILVGGGSNTRLFDDDDRARPGDSDQGQYPTFVDNAGGTQTAVVNTDGSYKYVGRLVIEFDDLGNVIPSSYDPAVSGAYATDAQGVADLSAEGLIDPEIQAIADAIEAEIVARESNVFGVSDVFLNGNRSGVDDPDDTDGVRTQETNLGNLTADANLAVAKEYDSSVVVSIKNGGGIRASIGETVVPPGGTEAVRRPNGELVDGAGNVIKPEGGISQNDIASTLAFNNNLTLLTLTKAELVAVLEHGIGAIPGVAGRFPQVSGVQFSYDPDLDEGDRIQNAVIVDESGDVLAELVEDGEIVGNPAETFRVVTLGFLANGGDGYPFPTGPAANRVDLDDLDGDGVEDGLFTGDATFAADGTEQDALAEYLDDNFNPANGGAPFGAADEGRNADERIQNLDFRPDSLAEAPEASEALQFQVAGAFAPASPDEGTAEVVAHDEGRLYVTNGEDDRIDVYDIAAPGTPVASIDLATVPGYGGVQSVDVANGVIAVAIATPDLDVFGSGFAVGANGIVALFSTADLSLVSTVEVGNLPDQLVFSADGDTLYVAGEGERNAESDNDNNPIGTVATVDVSDPANPVAEILDFENPFDEDVVEEAAREAGVRIREGIDFSQDVEPEYVAVGPDGSTIFVSLQENNAIARIDVASQTVERILPLGTIDYGLGVALDPDDDGQIGIRGFDDLVGLRMPDGIATYEVGGTTYVVTANEGDGRGDYFLENDDDEIVGIDPFGDEARVGDILDNAGAFGAVTIDPSVNTEGLERLVISTVDGDTDGDGDIDVLTAFGSRSFSIFDEDGALVFDSGDDFERIVAEVAGFRFNNDDGETIEAFGGEEDDNRSDAKGPEPEAVAVGEIEGRSYAFIGLERDSGIMVYDVSDPANASFVNYIPGSFVDFTPAGEPAAQAPEIIEFIPASQSQSGLPQIAVAYEVSGTTLLYDIDPGSVIEGGPRDDVLVGGFGNDTMRGRKGDDDIDGAGGNDSIRGQNGDDSVSGGEGDDLILGGRGGDEIDGGAGDDEILGQFGDDVLFGGEGDDFVRGQRGDDAIDGGDGDDSLAGNLGNDEIDGGDGNDSVHGGYGEDEVRGGAGDDELNGYSGNDEIFGDAGEDFIVGALGDDSLTGGADADTFFFGGGFGVDEILDFEVGVDTLEIAGATAAETVVTSIPTGGAIVAVGGASTFGVVQIVGTTGFTIADIDFV